MIDAAAKLDITPILCRQERMGMAIADGFSRITSGSRIGVFAMQHGPGAENAFPGAAQAFSENVRSKFQIISSYQVSLKKICESVYTQLPSVGFLTISPF